MFSPLQASHQGPLYVRYAVICIGVEWKEKSMVTFYLGEMIGNSPENPVYCQRWLGWVGALTCCVLPSGGLPPDNLLCADPGGMPVSAEPRSQHLLSSSINPRSHGQPS